MMESLSQLLDAVLELPKEELQPGVPIENRNNEIKLLSEVLSLEQVGQLRSEGIRIKRACLLNGKGPIIHFQAARAGEIRHILITRSGVTDRDQTVDISTVAELKAHLLNLWKEPAT